MEGALQAPALLFAWQLACLTRLQPGYQMSPKAIPKAVLFIPGFLQPSLSPGRPHSHQFQPILRSERVCVRGGPPPNRRRAAGQVLQ